MLAIGNDLWISVKVFRVILATYKITFSIEEKLKIVDY